MELHSLVKSGDVRERREPQERIMDWKRSKAGHLGEMTKIFRRLDEKLKDYHFKSEVMELSRCLKDQWARYCFLYNEIMSHLSDDSERLDESDRFNEKTREYERYSFLIEQFLTRAELQSGETIRSRSLSVQEPGISEECVSQVPRDAQSSVLTGSRKSRHSSRSSRSRENAAIESALAEVRLAQLTRAKERKLKQQLLQLENEIADAEDEADLARIKINFYEHVDSDKGSEGSEEVPIIDKVSIEPVALETLVQRSDPQVKEKYKSFIPGSCLEDFQPRNVIPDPSLLEEAQRSTLNPNAPTFPQPNSKCGASFTFRNTDSTSVLESVVTNMNLIATRASLPPLEVVKFSGNPCEFFRFKTRFYQMVESQNLSDAQKMSRLLQFLEGNARKAVAGFEGTPGGFKKAMRLLKLRFGQPHMIAKACVDALIEGPNISNSDREGLREFADSSRTLYQTLKAMNALSEMNLTNLGKMSGKLPRLRQI